MEFEMNEQREAYLAAKGKVVLNACPGSGKTTAIAKKLIELQKEYDSLYGKYSGVACLSFTNTAKDEINEKYTQLSGNVLRFPHKVSTIDSFINQHITLPYYYLMNKNFKRPKILDDNSFIDDAWKPKFRFKGRDGKPFCFAYPPSSIRFERDGTCSSNGYRPSEDRVNPEVFDDYCNQIKSWQIKSGLITTGDSAYIALHLLTEYPKIGNWLSLRFPHLIVDEAQDNSEIQHELFEKLVEHGLKNIEFVGDPYQSLYEWRNADPQIFLEKYADTENWQGLDLSDDRRSPQRIIECFSLLRKETDPKIDSACEEDREIPILVYKYTDTNSAIIVQHFDKQCQNYGLTNNQIVVRGNTLKNQMLGKEAEQRPWKSMIPYHLIEAKNQYLGNEIKAAIKTIRAIAATLKSPGAEFHGLKELESSLKYDHLFNALLLETLHNLPKFDLSITDWTSQSQAFLKDKLDIENEVYFDLKNRNSKYFDKAILMEPVENHFKKAYSESKIPITTVHQVKGKSLDAILIFFNANKHKDTITFKDIICNHDAFPSEKQRIIYVAMSRPKHLLAMAFPKDVSDDEFRKKFGDDIKIVTEQELNE